jgi:hypothetical protein
MLEPAIRQGLAWHPDGTFLAVAGEHCQSSRGYGAAGPGFRIGLQGLGYGAAWFGVWGCRVWGRAAGFRAHSWLLQVKGALGTGPRG